MIYADDFCSAFCDPRGKHATAAMFALFRSTTADRMGVVVQSQQSPEGGVIKPPYVTVLAQHSKHHPILILPCILHAIHTLRRRNGLTSTTSFAAVSSTGTLPKNKRRLDLRIGPAIGRRLGFCYDMQRSKGGRGRRILSLKYPFLYLEQVLVCFFSKAMLDDGDAKSQVQKGANTIAP